MGSEKFLIDLVAECEASGTDFGKGRAFGILETLRELSAKDAEIERLKAQLAVSEDKRKVLGEVIREALEPGVFGYQDRTSLVCREDAAVIELCERFGYGAVMDSASRCWGRKTQANGIPGAEITIAACASVRKRWCEDAAKALEAP